jgi:hypothetical protein
LLKIATVFNEECDHGDYGPVYDRPDARSQTIIARADYWFSVHRLRVFDLVLSNPDAVRLYRMSAQRHVAAVGCAH